MKTSIVNFRTAKRLVKDLEKIIKEGHYRNRTEVINDALRTFIRNYRRLDSSPAKKVKKK